jgi:hypothetical protein
MYSHMESIEDNTRIYYSMCNFIYGCFAFLVVRYTGVGHSMVVGSNDPYCLSGGLAVFILNFKGTPSQEEHKTIIRGLSEIN